MKRSLVFLLLIVVLAGWLGTLIARDPGYVLIAYQEYSIQTSLWVMLGLLIGFSLATYIVLRVVNLLRRSGVVYQGWRQDQKQSRALSLTTKGLALLAEGEFERARKYLAGGAENNTANGINYLAAARAADDLGDAEARETYLRLSEESDGSLHHASSVTAAELAYQRGDYDACISALAGVRSNRHVVHLRKRALLKQKDWRGLLALMPELKKVDKDDAAKTERVAAELGIAQETGNDDALNTLFKSLSSDLKAEAPLILCYANALKDKESVEPLIRSAVKKAWNAELVEAYGLLPESTLKTRKKTAEGWLKQHSDDAALHFCLGCIYEQSGEKELAKSSFSTSAEICSPSAANERLANLLALEGDFARSNEQLRLALQLMAHRGA